MPKIKQDVSKRKMTISRRPVLMVAIILIIAITGLILAKILTNTASDSGNQPDSTTSEVATQTETLGTNNNSSEKSTDYNNPQTPKQYEGENANNYTNLTGAITYAEVSGADLIIRTTIDQELPTSATCTLTATQNDTSIIETSGIINNPSSSSCEGFTIPASRLSSGTWKLEIKVTGNNKSGIITGEVTI